MTRPTLARLAGMGLALALAFPRPAHAQYDVLIRGGRLLDGTGNPWRYADVAIRGDRVVAVGRLAGATARRVIDARGRYVTPGFIDTHSHAGPGLATAELSAAEPLLAQGVTTVLVNPDGGGPVHLAVQREQLLEHGLGVNVGLMMPHGSVRREVIGMEARAPTSADLDAMRALVRDGMEAGAFGLSSGLYYAPGSYAATDEVVALARIAAEYGGVYASHIRDEADYSVGVVAAVEEVITIAREAGLPGVVTHIKALGPRVWGYSGAIIRRIEMARAEGVEVFADQYPYQASGTGIVGALIPRWAQVGGSDSLRARLRVPEQRARIREAVVENLDRRGGADRLQFRRYAPDPAVEGRTLAAVAADRGHPPADVALDLLLAGDAGLVSFNMDETDIAAFMRMPWTMTASDGGIVRIGVGVPHPRYYGTFPRRIRRYVVEQNVTDLRTAVRSMTSLPAMVYGLRDRGVLREGAVADIVVFDLARLRDTARYDDPHHYADGVDYVIVGGGVALDAGRFAERRYGRVLRRGVE